MYSKLMRRWCEKSHFFNSFTTSSIGYRFCTGIISSRSAANGLCRLTARCTFVFSRNVRMAGMTPTVDSVIRVGLQA